MHAKPAVLVILIAVLPMLNGCAALQPADTNGPRSNLPPYPISVGDPERFETATLAWQQISQRYGLGQNIQANLHPLTGTLLGLSSGSPIYLPRVGANPGQQSEEETRESLRRFIAEWRSLLGADPEELSLIERTDDASGLKTARYEQRPFRYPLRGTFGSLVIHFQNDRRVVDIASTCLPNSDRLQAALNGLTPKSVAENAVALIKGRAISASDASGAQHSFTLSNESIEARQLVVYVKTAEDRKNVDVHLAWEIDVTNGPIKTIYLDAITEQVIAVA